MTDVWLFEDRFEDQSYFCPTTTRHGSVWPITKGGQPRSRWHFGHPAGQTDQTYTIFEGTSEIQRLIISRAISGVHIQ
ncbi:MAG: hypothetical protein IVW52_06450 [Acidimicrobiales bacterium]|nr:hypothetical protein [Acidimicrobiales bacterium]